MAQIRSKPFGVTKQGANVTEYILSNPGGLTVSEALAKKLAAEKKIPPKTDSQAVDYTAEAQRELSSKLGRGVKIVTGRKKGRIELEYYGLDDLNDLLEALALLRARPKE